MHPITMIERIAIGADSLARLRAECEASEDRVWITRHLRATRHTLRGVPGRLVTVDLADHVQPADLLVVEIGRKVGRYDDRTDPSTRARDTITVRPWPTCLDGSGRPKRYDTPAGLRDVRTGGSLTVERWGEPGADRCQVCVTWDGGSWCSPVYQVLRSTLGDYDLRSVVIWHWRRYYSFIPAPDALQMADSFELRYPHARGLTLAEANRLASRDLYRLARDVGWRKLTVRERRKHGVDQMWVRADALAVRDAALSPDGTPTGAGQYSTEAAAGMRMPGVVVE